MSTLKMAIDKIGSGYYHLKFNLEISRWLGVVDNCDNAPIKSKILHAFLRYAIYFFGITFVVSCTCDLFFVKNDLVLIGEDLCVLVGLGLIFVKYIIYSYKFSEIVKIANDLIAISIRRNETTDRSKYYNIQRGSILLECSIISGFHLLGVVLVAVFIVISPNEGELPLRAFFPFDTRKKSYFTVAYAYQSICICVFVYLIIVIDTVCSILWHQIGIHFRILSDEFGLIKDYYELATDCKLTRDQILLQRLRILTMRHQYIITLAQRLNSVTNPMMAAQILSSNLTICLTGFEATLTYDDVKFFLKFATYLTTALCQLLLWCFYGDFVRMESIKICESLLLNIKYSFNKNYIDNLRFVLMRAQKPIYMKAGGLHILSFETYLMVLRGSYSYFALLRTLSESQ